MTRFFYMKMRALMLLLVFLVLPFAAAENVQQTLHFVDGETGEMLSNSLVSLTLDSDSDSRRHLLFMKDDALVISLPSGMYDVTALLDNPSTDAPDYSFTGNIDLQGESTLTLFPIAQVNGNVYDASHTLVSGAMLDLRCDNLMTASFPERTDKYGSFVAYVPIGKCVIAAADNQFIGKNAITTERGISYTVDITLDAPLVQRNAFLWPIFIVLVVVLVFLLRRFIRIPRRKRNTENPNADLARNLDEQIKTRGEFQYPVMVSLTDLEIVNDPSSSYCLSLNLRDDAQIIYEPQLAHENDGKKFLETGESGLPVFCDNGKRILYTRENGLSRLSLGRFSYFYSVWGNLGNSYPDGRIIVLSGKTTK